MYSCIHELLECFQNELLPLSRIPSSRPTSLFSGLIIIKKLAVKCGMKLTGFFILLILGSVANASPERVSRTTYCPTTLNLFFKANTRTLRLLVRSSLEDKVLESLSTGLKKSNSIANFSHELLRIENLSGPLFDETTLRQVGLKFKAFYDDVFIVELHVFVKNKSMRFDININPRFQKNGLYSLLFSDMVSVLPELKFIPGRFTFKDSVNADIFITHAFGGVEEFSKYSSRKFFEHFMPEQGLRLREQILAAYHTMPAAKVREEVGFSRLSRIVLSPGAEPNTDQAMVAFLVERGPPMTDDSISIVLEEDSFARWELNSKGIFIPNARANVSLGDYDLIWP